VRCAGGVVRGCLVRGCVVRGAWHLAREVDYFGSLRTLVNTCGPIPPTRQASPSWRWEPTALRAFGSWFLRLAVTC